MRRLLPRADDGIALPVVLGVSVLLMILVTTGLTVATSGLRAASTDQNATGAYDAAIAGVQDYRSRIGADPSYGSFGNKDAVFSTGSTLSTPTGSATNYAFGIGTSGTWATVPNGTATDTQCPSDAVVKRTPCFRYEVDNRDLVASGKLRLRSTGRVGSSTRSVIVTFKQDGFYDYLYFTDYETVDPTIAGSDETACTVYAWSKAGRPAGCSTPTFVSSDLLDGPVHSNDVINSCGAKFNALVTTAYPTSPYYKSGSGCPTTTFDKTANPSKLPTHVSTVQLPDTNTSMRSQAHTDLTSNTGCLYTGPTVVKYLGNGKMTVWSPWTQFTNMGAKKSEASKAPQCGAPGTDSNQLGSKGGATVDELAGNLLYVQTLPTDTNDPNYAPTTTIPPGMTCLASNGTSNTSDAANSVGWAFGDFSFPIRTKSQTEAAPDGWDGTSGLDGSSYYTSTGRTNTGGWDNDSWSTNLRAYNCRAGDLYISGKYKTQTTAASENYVYITGDLTAYDRTQDILGLVGQNAVLIWNPVTANKASLLGDTDRNVDAAILSVAHTFQVQNYNVGPIRGRLTVFGSIAQKYRGAVGTNSNGVINRGYSKTYSYDPLLTTTPPPFFLAPSGVNFNPQLYVGALPAFTGDGASTGR